MTGGAPRLAWVDVFAAGPLLGNPLAVVLEGEGWSAAEMQGLAAELRLSETAFALPPSGDADVRLRIFTPTHELPMAGHPVVGASWVLHAAGVIGEAARVETGAGVLDVRVRGDVATMEQAPPQAGPLVDPGEVGRALGGIAPLADPPARVWSTGVPQLMLRVADSAAVAGARPDGEALAELGRRDGWSGVSVYALTADHPDGLAAHVRHFASGVGVLEDPVTGSAAGALGACLAAAGLGRDGVTQLVVRQGRELGRAGEVAVRVESRDGAPRHVQVGGRVVPLFEGRFVVETLR